jgi:chorismate synthase
MGNSFGTLFRVTSYGESHGGGIGCVVDGCPPGILIDLGYLQHQLDRRRPGQSALVSQRKESDRVELLSGLDGGRTLGTPICFAVRNEDARPESYAELAEIYRPSHADYSYDAKFGLRAVSGGGRASARETVARVAAGALARQILKEQAGVEIVGWVEQVGDLALPTGGVDEESISEADVDASPVRCPHAETAAAMEALILGVRKDGDTVGGTVRCIARAVPPGWGEPVFDKLEAELAKAMLSLPACKGFDVGAGFASISMRGSTHNDPFVPGEGGGRIRTRGNHSGGIQGGISNGETIRLRAAFKPVATIFREQDTVDRRGRPVRFTAKGRHDPCVLPRAVPIVEAMTALVLVDAMLRQRARGR